MPSRTRDLTVLAVAAGGVVAGAHEARRGALRARESQVFARVNALTHRPYVLVWTVMQAGSLGGALAIGGGVAAAGRRDLGERLALVGSLAWLGSKVVKPFAQRGRPAAVVGDGTRVLGRAQAGLGYPSGHAGVAVALASAAAPHVPRRWRWSLWVGAAAVAGSRMYVGAHLPLDVAGGAALGLATERGVRLVTGRA